MVYGATGRLGERLIQKALACGMTPIMGGRSIAKLRALADKYQLPWRLLDLNQVEQSIKALQGVAWIYCASSESSCEQVVRIAMQANVGVILPHTLTESMQGRIHDMAKQLHGKPGDKPSGQPVRVIHSAGFHSAVTDSLIAVARDQARDERFRFLHVVLFGLPLSEPGYVRDFLERCSHPVDVPSMLSPGSRRRQKPRSDWARVLLQALSVHRRAAMRWVAGNRIAGMKWWRIPASESIPDVTEAPDPLLSPIPLAVYIPVVPWLLPFLRYFSRWMKGINDEDALMTRALHWFSHRASRSSRSAVWLVAETESGDFRRFGIECPGVFDMTVGLAIESVRCVLDETLALEAPFDTDQIRVNRPAVNWHDDEKVGPKKAIRCFGPDWVLSVSDTLRYTGLQHAFSRSQPVVDEVLAI